MREFSLSAYSLYPPKMKISFSFIWQAAEVLKIWNFWFGEMLSWGSISVHLKKIMLTLTQSLVQFSVQFIITNLN